MSCVTRGGQVVEECVYDWLDKHPESSGFLSNVFEIPDSLDVVVSLQSSDGILRLPLIGQQSEKLLMPDVRQRILYWLENLKNMPIVED